MRLTKPRLAVLDVLMHAKDDAPAWGLSICREADLGSGTVYPILDAFTQAGWVESWTEDAPHPGRPPRRYYKMTSQGRAEAQAAQEARNARRMRLGFALRLVSGWGAR